MLQKIVLFLIYLIFINTTSNAYVHHFDDQVIVKNMVDDAVKANTYAIACSACKFSVAKRAGGLLQAIYGLYDGRIIRFVNFYKGLNSFLLELKYVHYLPNFVFSASIIAIALLLAMAEERSFLLSSYNLISSKSSSSSKIILNSLIGRTADIFSPVELVMYQGCIASIFLLFIEFENLF